MTVWQIAAGKRGRYYDDLFLNHDIMFMGPGREGPYHGNEDVYSGRGIWGSIEHFAESAQPGDAVLLRKGHEVVSIGMVADRKYLYEPNFDDIYDWDLQHVRRVSWNRTLDRAVQRLQKTGRFFDNYKQQATFTRVKSKRILKKIEPLLPKLKVESLRRMPVVSDSLDLDTVGRRLFEEGLPNDAVDNVLAAITRQRRMCEWYEEFEDGYRPTEHEVVAHLILPLMLALGWSEQLLAIEWKHVDLAAFVGTPTESKRCILVCEAKRRGRGLQHVLEQAVEYTREHELKRCRRILLTDGLRFYLYRKRRGGWGDRPDGYVNMAAIRERNAAPYKTNGIKTIMALTPMKLMRGGRL